ncbi:MAG: VWA domain-containing protein [Clostridia bacterium]|nr:VWA domain-containing protein [Clostridia bacterium]
MSLQFPLGLLALIGIPVLILIYIIKSKYTEQTIASTYIWRLSEKFLKKRKPISKLQGILTLILQILAVAVAALLIAHPVFTIPDSATDYYFILDGSASMNMQANGSTRFERAQNEICKVIDSSKNGSTYSLVFVSSTTDVVFESTANKEQAKTNVKELKAGWTDTDCLSSLAVAQTYFDEHHSSEIYLVTDKEYVTGNLNLVNVSKSENNCAFAELPSYQVIGSGITATGKVVSYNSDAQLTVELSVQRKGATAVEKVGETVVNAIAGQPVEFTVSAPVTSFEVLQLGIAEKDALAEDNVIILYEEKKMDSRQVLIVANDTINDNGLKESVYLQNAITLAGNASVEVCTIKGEGGYEEKEQKGELSKYGLIVFNGVAPEVLPKNVAIWIVGVEGTMTGSDLQYLSVEKQLNDGDYFEPTYSTSTRVQDASFRKGLINVGEGGKTDVAVEKYVKYKVPNKFTRIMSVGTDPVITAGLNKNNDRQVVFAFRLGDSDFGAKVDFLLLVRNLINYSFPEVIEETSYVCGDTIAVNVVPNCEDMVIISPSGKNTPLDTFETEVCEVQLTEAGTYTLSVRRKGVEEAEVYYAFASVPEAESRSEEGGVFILTGEKKHEYADGYYDDLLAFLIVIAVLVLADWGVYCYEQYQLR